MYLSRVEVDRENRRKSRDLSHVGAYHHWVEQSFPDELEKNIRSRKLWRLDYLNGKEFLLIVSETPPNLGLLEKYGVIKSSQTKEYDTFLHSLQEGTQARFRVTLNPVVSVVNKEAKRGQVKPHVTVDQQLKFLRDRSEKNGFSLKENEYTIVERGYVEYRKSGQIPLRLSKVTYEGVLRISDVNLFSRTLTEGIGKKKAYGFGMMTIIPITKT